MIRGYDTLPETGYMVMILYPIHDTWYSDEEDLRTRYCEGGDGRNCALYCSTQQCNRNGWLPCGWDDDWDDVWRARVGAPVDDDSILYRYCIHIRY